MKFSGKDKKSLQELGWKGEFLAVNSGLWEDIDDRPTSRENGWKSILKACLHSRHSNTSGSLRCILWWKSREIGFVLCFRAHIYGVAQRAKKSRRPFRAKDSNSRSQSQTFVEQNRCNGLVRTVKCTLSICFFFTSLRNKIIISLYIQLLLVSLQTNSRISCLVMKTYSMTFFSTGPHRSGVSPPCCGSE